MLRARLRSARAWYSIDGSCRLLRQMAHVSVQMLLRGAGEEGGDGRRGRWSGRVSVEGGHVRAPQLLLLLRARQLHTATAFHFFTSNRFFVGAAPAAGGGCDGPAASSAIGATPAMAAALSHAALHTRRGPRGRKVCFC